MFGELVGLWSVAVWQSMGSPAALALVEVGPGRGPSPWRTRSAPPGSAPTIVPPSWCTWSRRAPPCALGEAALAPSGVPIRWHDDLAAVPPGPTLVIANEFFDALPIRQFVATERGWCERLVGLQDGRLAFGLRAEPQALGRPPRVGDLLELPEAAVALRGPSHGVSSDMAARRSSSITATGTASATPCRRSRTMLSRNPLSDPARPISLPMFRSGGWPMPLEARAPSSTVRHGRATFCGLWGSRSAPPR